MQFNQDNDLLEGEVVVDETLWTHEELEGAQSNWTIYDSQVWVFGLIEKNKPADARMPQHARVFVVPDRTT